MEVKYIHYAYNQEPKQMCMHIFAYFQVKNIYEHNNYYSAYVIIF